MQTSRRPIPPPASRESCAPLREVIRHRGIAMLIVIISVMTATILTMSYLSSRDNSLAIGTNVIGASSARWAALAGVDLAIATLETDSDWRTAASDGVLIDNLPFLDGRLTVHVTDADTGEPPTEHTVIVDLRAIMTGGGIEQSATAVAVVATPTEGVFQLDLADFAAFAEEEIRLSSGGMITRWATAPRTRLGLPISIGVRSTSSDSIRASSSSSFVDARAFYPSDAHSNVVDVSDVDLMPTNDAIPMPAPPPHNRSNPGSNAGRLNTPNNVVLNQQPNWTHITVQEGARLRIPNASTIVISEGLLLQRDARVRIESDATIVVFGDVEMNPDSYIELTEGASLRMFVKGNFDIDEAYIGPERGNPSIRDNSGSALWFDPNRIQLFSFGDSITDWNLDTGSVVMASMYAPQARIELDDASAVYGRIAAERIRIRGGSTLYYDHMLDHFAGYANARSVLFDADGHIYPIFRDMIEVDTTALTTLADDTGIQFRAFNMRIGTGGLLDAVGSTSLGAPTPRPIAVDHQLLSVGIEPRSWE